MKSMTSSKFRNQKGQGMIEYIILSGLIGIFCLATFKSIGSSIKNQGGKINTQIRNIKITK